MKKYSRFFIVVSMFLLVSCNQEPQKTTLMQAAEKGQLTEVQQLIQKDSNINERNQQGLDALLYAIINDRRQIVNYLLIHGANAKSSDRLGNSALIIAATVGDLAIITELIKHGADINATNQKGITALIAAAGAGQLKTLVLLLSVGADPCLKNKDQQTALQVAKEWWGSQEIEQAFSQYQELKPLVCAGQS